MSSTLMVETYLADARAKRKALRRAQQRADAHVAIELAGGGYGLIDVASLAKVDRDSDPAPRRRPSIALVLMPVFIAVCGFLLTRGTSR